MTIDELEKKLKTKELETIYLLYGEETFLRDIIQNKIKKIFGELILGINYVVLDENTISNLISEIETPAFGYPKKLIIVKNSNILKKDTKNRENKIANIRDKIDNYFSENIESIKDSVVIVFIEQEADKLKLYKTIEKYGIVCNFEFQKPDYIVKKLKNICNLYKVNVKEETLKFLIENCGTSMQELVNEIRKLIEYTGEGNTIEKENVTLLANKKIDSVIFDLTDSLGNKNIEAAIDVLSKLLYNKEPIQKILITLYNHFKKIYITKVSDRLNLNLVESLKLKPNLIFLVNKYKKQSTYFTEKTLQDLLKELSNLDYKYKKGMVDLEVGLESILCNYCCK